jgi:hypothetical protein
MPLDVPPPRSIGRAPGSEGNLIAECRLALGDSGISAHDFARLMGTDIRTVQRWEANSGRVPGSAWLALYLMFEPLGLAGDLPVPDRELLDAVRPPLPEGFKARRRRVSSKRPLSSR